MKTIHLCWLALAGCASAALAQTAGSAGNIGIYGIIDANLQYRDSGQGKQVSMQNGGLLFGRLALVGFSSSKLGTLTLGHQYEPLHTLNTQFPTHQAGCGDAAGAFIPAIQDIRWDNTIKYVTLALAGVTLTVFDACRGAWRAA